MKGLIIEVYRAVDFPDCTLDGISSKHKTLTLIPCNGPFEPSEDRPAVTMITRRFADGSIYKHLEPCDENGKPLPGWWMFGGNYACTSDSRFRELNPYPLPIHDRQEP